MNNFLPQPPDIAAALELPRWLGLLWNYVRPSASTSGDAAASIPSGSTYHGVTALTAPRTLTLPPTRSVPDGSELVVQDESAAAGTHTITLAAAAGDTAAGAATISSNRGRRVAIKRATTWWIA